MCPLKIESIGIRHTLNITGEKRGGTSIVEGKVVDRKKHEEGSFGPHVHEGPLSQAMQGATEVMRNPGFTQDIQDEDAFLKAVDDLDSKIKANADLLDSLKPIDEDQSR